MTSKSAIIGLLLLGVASVAASGATVMASFSVSATVVSSCLVSVPPMTLGRYAASGMKGQSNVSVACTLPTAYTTTIIQGSASGSRPNLAKGFVSCSTSSSCAPVTRFPNTATLKAVGGGLPIYNQNPPHQDVGKQVTPDLVTVVITY